MSDRVVIIGAGAIDGTRAAVVNRGTRSQSDAIRAITVLPLLPLESTFLLFLVPRSMQCNWRTEECHDRDFVMRDSALVTKAIELFSINSNSLP